MASLLQRELLDDEDSLFGSPPPSPGRSPSPTLALPGSTCSGIDLSATQNVGTIALPGSHHLSELPLNPLALPSSLQQAHRPPAHSSVSQRPVYNHVFHAAAGSTSSSPASSRSSSQGMKTKSKESTTLRLPGPEIALPDPSAPPPAHFLRNQTALLGMAGLVGGIKPSNLSMLRHTRGATSSNPIVIEDEDDTPAIGRTSGFRQPYQQAIDPALLPAPSNQDVVSMLIRQKNIFPVLESILKLIAAGSAHQPSLSQDQPQGSQRRSTSQQPHEQTPVSRPVKKRKLNRVPAGATDWDVPYPFEQGEGPDAYHTTWERDRGKQLISQLVSLIKTAARKAATKKYLKSQETTKRSLAEKGEKGLAAERSEGSEGVRVNGYYKPETAVYGPGQRAATQQCSEVLTDASYGRKGTQSAAVGVTQLSRPLALPETQPQTPFDQLISSLMAASPDQTSSFHISPISANAPPDLPLGASGKSESRTVQSGNEGDDQVLFDSWMNALQAFPMPSGGFSQPQPSSSDGPPLHSSDDFGFFDPTLPCFDLNGAFEEGSLPSVMKGIGSSGMSIDDNVGQPTIFADMSHSAELDYLIDPEFLAVSKPNNERRSEESLPASLAPSPMPSMSSYGDSDPKTPTSSGWDITLPGIYVDGSAMLGDGIRLSEGSHGHQGILQGAFWSDHPDHFRELPGNNESNASEDLTSFTGVDKGKGREVVPSAISLSSSTVFDAQNAAFGAHQGSEPCVPVPSSSQASKEEVLRRGHERKRRLEEELQRVRLQLWETTVEQAALSHLVNI